VEQRLEARRQSRLDIPVLALVLLFLPSWGTCTYVQIWTWIVILLTRIESALPERWVDNAGVRRRECRDRQGFVRPMLRPPRPGYTNANVLIRSQLHEFSCSASLIRNRGV